MKQKIKRNRKVEIAILIGIVVLSIFFRFYKLKQLFQFSFDEEVWSYRIHRVIKYQDWRLIGGEISSTGLFTGPGFVYFHTPLYLISKLDPLIGGYWWSGVGVLTTILVYFFSRSYFGRRTAAVAGILYATSFMMTLHDRRFWNVSPIPIVSLLSGWLLLRGLQGKKYAWLLMALVLTFGIHSHFSIVAALIAVVIVGCWQVCRCHIRVKNRRELMVAMGVFLLLNLGPIAVFDLRHNWWHVRALKNLAISFTQPKKTESNADFLGIAERFSQSVGSLVYLGRNIDVADEMSHCQALIDARPKAPWWAQVVGWGVVVWMLIRSLVKRKQPLSQFILVLLLVNIAGLFVYRERVFTYHFAPLMPFFFIYGGYFLTSVLRSIRKVPSLMVGVSLIVVFMVLNFDSLLTAQSEVSFAVKKQIVSMIISQTQDQSLSIEVLPSCEIYGFRYLFTALGKPVAKSWTDSSLGFLYPEERSEKVDTEVTLAIPDEGKTDDYQERLTKTEQVADRMIQSGKVKIFFASEPKQRDSNTKVD